MSAVMQDRSEQPLDLTAIIDGIDEACCLVQAADMAVGDFRPEPRVEFLCTLLNVISDKLRALSESISSAGDA